MLDNAAQDLNLSNIQLVPQVAESLGIHRASKVESKPKEVNLETANDAPASDVTITKRLILENNDLKKEIIYLKDIAKKQNVQSNVNIVSDLILKSEND